MHGQNHIKYDKLIPARGEWHRRKFLLFFTLYMGEFQRELKFHSMKLNC